MDEALFTCGLKGVFEIAILHAWIVIFARVMLTKKKTKRKTAKKKAVKML